MYHNEPENPTQEIKYTKVIEILRYIQCQPESPLKAAGMRSNMSKNVLWSFCPQADL